jgi:hypothetical protein
MPLFPPPPEELATETPLQVAAVGLLIARLRAGAVSLPPRLIVVLYAISTLVGWLLGISGVTSLPATQYVAADLVLDVVVITGLWLLWRPAWVLALGLTLLGEATVAVHPREYAALLVVGAVQLALLLLPPLRRKLRSRPTPVAP